MHHSDHEWSRVLGALAHHQEHIKVGTVKSCETLAAKINGDPTPSHLIGKGVLDYFYTSSRTVLSRASMCEGGGSLARDQIYSKLNAGGLKASVLLKLRTGPPVLLPSTDERGQMLHAAAVIVRRQVWRRPVH
eukprot:1472045-Amphidinium_carterae.1